MMMPQDPICTTASRIIIIIITTTRPSYLSRLLLLLLSTSEVFVQPFDARPEIAQRRLHYLAFVLVPQHLQLLTPQLHLQKAVLSSMLLVLNPLGDLMSIVFIGTYDAVV